MGSVSCSRVFSSVLKVPTSSTRTPSMFSSGARTKNPCYNYCCCYPPLSSQPLPRATSHHFKWLIGDFSSRVAPVISGQMAVKQCTHTGTRRMMKMLWLKTACMWTSTADGEGQTVKRCYQAPSVRKCIQVSASSEKLHISHNRWGS